MLGVPLSARSSGRPICRSTSSVGWPVNRVMTFTCVSVGSGKASMVRSRKLEVAPRCRRTAAKKRTAVRFFRLKLTMRSNMALPLRRELDPGSAATARRATRSACPPRGPARISVSPPRRRPSVTPHRLEPPRRWCRRRRPPLAPCVTTAESGTRTTVVRRVGPSPPPRRRRWGAAGARRSSPALGPPRCAAARRPPR